MSDSSRRESWPSWVLIAPLILVGVVSAGWIGRLMPSCFFHQETGFFCPGCGATRAAMALAEGRWMEALGRNGLFVIGVVAGVIWIVLSALGERFRKVKWLRPFRWKLWFLWLALGVLGVFGVLRNLPGMAGMAP